jgi:hypothetical protein
MFREPPPTPARAGQSSTACGSFPLLLARRHLANTALNRAFDHGVIIQASLSGGDGVVYGNANRTLIEGCRSITNAGDGFKISGNDTNVSKVDTCHAQGNTGWGFTDDTLIGALWLCCTDEGNVAGGYRTLRVASPSSFLACETENATPARFSINIASVVRGGNVEPISTNPRWFNYSGLDIKSGNTLTLYRTDNLATLSLSNDGTNVLITGPIKVVGSIQCRSGTIGYILGNGGAVTQATSKATGVTLNTPTGQITMNAAALAAGAKASFAVTNSNILAADTVLVSVASGGTANAYRAAVTAVANGVFTITVENITAGSLSEAPVINFTIIKGASA